MIHPAQLLFCFGLFVARAGGAEPFVLRHFTESEDATHATIRVQADRLSPHRIPRFLTGKFAEHLGFNIYGGMDAQILRNPTFADYPFWNGAMTPDGVTKFQVDDEKIAQELRRLATRFGAPEPELDALVAARADGLAALWTRFGPRDAVQVSPDAGSHGRAQRVQVRTAEQGVAQWIYLPLHRVRQFEFEILARSPDLNELTISLATNGADQPLVFVKRSGLKRDWSKLGGTFGLPRNAPAEAPYRFALVAPVAGQLIVSHVFVRPADHIQDELKNVTREETFPVLDALAAMGTDGALWLSLVHRGAKPLHTSVSVDHFNAAATAQVRTLSAEVPWAANTLEKPNAITPRDTTVPVNGGTIILDLQPFSVVRVRVPNK